MSQKLGKYFVIRNRKTRLILSIKNGADVPGAYIVTLQAPVGGRYGDSQLWFYDALSTRIRSKLNKFCLDINPDDKITVQPYQKSSASQKWVMTENEIQTMDDFELLIGLESESRDAGEHAYCMQSDGSQRLQWTFEHVPAQFFKLRSKFVHHKILDVEKANKRPGAKVIIWVDKGNLADNQLWYEDKNGIVRSKLNDFALDSSGGKDIVLNRYDHAKESHQWYFIGGTIRNRFNKQQVLAVKKGAIVVLTYDTVQVEEYDGDPNQLWSTEYLPDDTSIWNHGGAGKHFYIRNQQTGLVFTLKNSQLAPKTEVITCGRDITRKDYDSQSFYYDEMTNTIRASANDYCLEMHKNTLVINPYDPFAKTQHWKIFGRKIKYKHDPDKVLTSEDVAAPADDDSDGDDVGATASVATQTSARLKLQQYYGGDLQHFDITHIHARSFYIRSLLNNKVLDIKQNNQSVGAEIFLFEPWPKIAFNQLWYEDERGIIRSRLNGYVLQLTSRGAKTAAYDPGSKDQHYVIVGDRVQNMHDAGTVMEVNTRKALGAMGVKGAVFAGKYDGDVNQKWAIDYV